MKYDLAIINRLLDKYEGNKQSYSDVERPQVIRIIVKNDKVFFDYWKEDAYKYRGDIHFAVRSLEEKGLVSAEYDSNSNLLKYVTLKTENVDAAFEFAKREKKTDLIGNELTVANKCFAESKDGSILHAFCKAMIERLSERKTHKSYFEDATDLSLKCKMIKALEENDEEALLRNFSKKKFADSKFLERNGSFLLKIFNEFGDEEFESFNDLCQTHYIVKNHGYAYVKNGLRFKINGQVIDLDSLGVEFSLSDEAIEKMELLEISKKKILTIENLTTFHYFNDNQFTIIYLAGFHNSTKRKLIEKVKEFSNDLEWYHFGDIDWGGLQILLDLREKTGIFFKPYLMDASQLEKYANECQKLTENDRKKLKLLADTNKEFNTLIQYMLDHDSKLEQESIVL